MSTDHDKIVAKYFLIRNDKPGNICWRFVGSLRE